MEFESEFDQNDLKVATRLSSCDCQFYWPHIGRVRHLYTSGHIDNTSSQLKVYYSRRGQIGTSLILVGRLWMVVIDSQTDLVVPSMIPKVGMPLHFPIFYIFGLFWRDAS